MIFNIIQYASEYDTLGQLHTQSLNLL